eukprot:scaffold7592_cov146-Isochrysis_galbana.AAC.2
MNLRATVGSPVHCGIDLGTTRWISRAKNSATSGFFISRAVSAITAPSIEYRSGFLIGLWRPERGQFFMRSMYSFTSATAVSGTFIIVPPFSGSGISLTFAAPTHLPPTILWPMPGDLALMVFGSTVAHDGTERSRRESNASAARGTRLLLVRVNITWTALLHSSLLPYNLLPFTPRGRAAGA